MKRFLAIFNISCGLILGLVFSATTEIRADEKYLLSESADKETIFTINSTVEISGELQTPQEKKLLSLPLQAKVNLDYTEKRLPPAGRDARAYRSVRVYERAKSDIKVSENQVTANLRSDRSEVAMYGFRQGLKPVSIKTPLTRNELDLLQSPGDSLSMLTLLPPEEVEVGDEWSVPTFGAQMLTGSEALVSSEINCKLEKVEDQIATVSFKGKIKGASGGAQSEISLSGQYEYEMEIGYLKTYDLTQKVKQDPGPVHPGMDVTARVHTERFLAVKPELITEEFLASVPLNPTDEMLELEFNTPWKMGFRHSRDWYVFQQTGQMVILRLVNNGNFIAQCNMQPLTPALPGKHVPEKQFQADIQTSLGSQLEELADLEKPESDEDVKILRVLATGKARKMEMNWIYYLCAAPSGKQSSFVFSVESKLLPRLKEQEEQLIRTVRFK